MDVAAGAFTSIRAFDETALPTDEATDAAAQAAEEERWREPQPAGLARRAPLPPISAASNARLIEMEDLDE